MTAQPDSLPGQTGSATMEELCQGHRALRSAVLDGDKAAVAHQHRRGKRTARERLGQLLDAGTFTEWQTLRRRRGGGGVDLGPHTDGVVTGWGEIHGRPVFVYAQDFTLGGGALGEAHADKICRLIDRALSVGAPVVGLVDSGGARIQEGVMALDAYGRILFRNVQASGVVPQISVLLGPCAGGAAYSPALTDFTFMVRGTSHMYLTGPEVVRSVTGADVEHEELGGADLHGRITGSATFVHRDEVECLEEVRYLVSLLPSNNTDPMPAHCSVGAVHDPRPALAEIVPTDPRQPYDMRRVIEELVDPGEFLELHEHWAANVLCVLARIDGQVVGVVANQPLVLAGALDAEASQKASRFVRFCDAFRIPLVTLVDAPGFLPGPEQEQAAVIRHGAKLLFAYCEATVPRIQIVLRKAYGGAYIVMDSRSIGSDLCLAWPTNEIAVLGPDAAVAVIHRRDLAAAHDREALRRRLVRSYAEEMLDPLRPAEVGVLDDIIDPGDTRSAIARALAVLRNKRAAVPTRKHANMPL